MCEAGREDGRKSGWDTVEEWCELSNYIGVLLFARLVPMRVCKEWRVKETIVIYELKKFFLPVFGCVGT